jgi:hypothetical protein
MGYLKHLQLENEGLRCIAEEIAVRAGLLARCPSCETTYDPLSWRHVESYMLANRLITDRDELVEGLGSEHRRRLTDILQHIDRGYPNGCRCGARGRPW